MATATATAADTATEQLLLEVPEGWVQAIDRRTGNLRLAEYYPAATTESWSEKLTVEALSGDNLPDPLVFANGLADEQREVCNDFSDDNIFAGFENAYPSTVHLMQCPQNKKSGRALVTMIKIIKGNEALYTITRIWRFAPMEKDPATGELAEIPIDHKSVGGWSHVLSKITVCDTALAAHPCPNTATVL
jgi:hypothetical protein